MAGAVKTRLPMTVFHRSWVYFAVIEKTVLQKSEEDMNALFSPSPFHVEYIDMRRCLVLRNYATSRLMQINEMIVEDGGDDNFRLLRLDIHFSQGFLNHRLETIAESLNEWNQSYKFEVIDVDEHGFSFHVFQEKEKSFLELVFRIKPSGSSDCCFRLEKIYNLGFSARQPTDLAFETIEMIQREVEPSMGFQWDRRTACITISPIDAILKYFFPSQEKPMPRRKEGASRLSFDHHKGHLQYDYRDVPDYSIDRETPIDGERPLYCYECLNEDDELSFHSDDLISQQHTFDNDLVDHERAETREWEEVRDAKEIGAHDALCDAPDEPKSGDIVSNLSHDIEVESQNDDGLSDDLFRDIDVSHLFVSPEQHKEWFSDCILSSDSLLDIAPLSHDDRIQFKLERKSLSCPILSSVHRAVAAGESIEGSIVKSVLKEAQETLPSSMEPLILYFIHYFGSQTDHALRPYILSGMDDEYAPFVADILYDIYIKDHNYTMLLSLIQRQINESVQMPKRSIRYQFMYIDVLIYHMEMFSLAIRKLEALKPLIIKYGSCQDDIHFAKACHQSKHTGMAIQFLRNMMKSAEDTDSMIQLGSQLIEIMIEHNEPIQSIITVCSNILSAAPQHVETLEQLAQCLERANHIADATETYQLCLDYHVQAWELAKFQMESNATEENKQRFELYTKKALAATRRLEELYGDSSDIPLRSLVLRQHLRLEPNDLMTLSKLIKDFEVTHAYHEIIHVCLEFLSNNIDLDKKDKIALYITLYHVYQRLNDDDNANEQLNLCKMIDENDPRVIALEIERSRQLGNREDEYTYRIALIDVLPPKEAVNETLSLVRLYETNNESTQMITDLLRRINSRIPNQPLILLELRQYLRKSGMQTFELAVVLEKLARVTTDLQTRKNILYEASEVQEKLGNKQASQKLYQEAQLCSPIDPQKATSFINDKLRMSVSQPLSSVLSRDEVSVSISALISSHDMVSVEQDESSPKSHDVPTGTHAVVMPVSSTDSDGKMVSSADCKVQTADNPILDARLRGNTQALLDRLMESIKDKPLEEQSPRVLQEIGCIYLYDQHDSVNARQYLERACTLSEEVANGEQTLNALEVIYQSMNLYSDLCDIYERKIQISPTSEERRKYEIQLARTRFEHLGETDTAIDILNSILKKTPANETALQLIAQIYIDTHQTDKAIETLKNISSILKDYTKQKAQNILRLISLYIESGRNDDAKKELKTLLNYQDAVDQLMVIEQYKSICRKNDEWEDLLDILLDEIAYYIKKPKSECSPSELLKPENRRYIQAGAEHTFREYADICYYKLRREREAAEIYAMLAVRNPDDSYPRNALKEILEADPENDFVRGLLEQLVAELSLSSSKWPSVKKNR